jgi:hypothetical protein
MSKVKRYPCPCCGYFTFWGELITPGTYEICPICKWEDDISPYYANEVSSANKITLYKARTNFKKFGVVWKGEIGRSRAPKPEEIPPHWWSGPLWFYIQSPIYTRYKLTQFRIKRFLNKIIKK